MDFGLFIFYFLVTALFGFLALFLRGKEWALFAFIGGLIGALVTSAIASDGSIAVGYINVDNVSQAITNPDNLPVTIMVMLTLMDFVICGWKGLKG